ncbi:histone deacetylase [Penicillium sp. IBT 16267x]|nr:histone deacetylase [Penicillium sp. IBT 16267x]
MDGDEDTVMSDPRKVSALPPHASLTQTTFSLNPHRREDPSLAPSVIPRASSKSPSSGPDPASLQDQPASTGIIPPDQFIKTSPPESNSAELSFSRTDSLVEPKSEWSDDEMPASSSSAAVGLAVASLPSGLCYDSEMRYHCEIRPTADLHPEDPRRIFYIYDELCQAGLVDDPTSARPLAPQTLRRILARRATQQEISTVHTEAHYDFVKSTTDMSDDELLLLEAQRDSIYFNQLTFEASRLSAGGAIETCLAVARRDVKNAIAVIRPPGHHAEQDKAMGFCLFNNVSVAARVCQNTLGESCRKIMILDWDVHHGNGIQKAFYDDPNVLYISIHVHKNGAFYPGTHHGDMDMCGTGPGLGKNVNIPWETQGMNDGDYMHALQEVVMPIGQEFNPDLVIIAAGFDAAAGDVLGGCFVTPPCYAQMTHMLMGLAGGKIAVCLEGGYNFQSIARSALAVTKTLMGDPPERLIKNTPGSGAIITVSQVKRTQSHYWRCMTPRPLAQQTQGIRFHNRLHGMTGQSKPRNSVKLINAQDSIRELQAKQLYESCKLTELWIYRTAISKSFEHQVLASPNYNQAVPMLIIFHDPPEILGVTHPLTGKLEAHNCWLHTDIQRDYVALAVEKGWAVIDVNVPMHISRDQTTGKFEDEDVNRPHATEELAAYLWDNYIDSPSNATDVFFMGVGTAFYGVTSLLINRDNLYQSVNGVISFVSDHPVRAVASATQTWMSKWYRENSLVFVSHKHGVWEHKPSKRYGNLRKSPQATISDMLAEHKEEAFDWISDHIRDQSESEDDDSSMKG